MRWWCSGLVVLWRAGLVSFGQALYYCIGAYAVALAARWTGFTDAFALVLIGGVAAGLVAVLIGFLLARYREIFFAMLSLALSMILYGVLVKTESLGSTDGFSVATPTFFGYAPHRDALGLSLYWLTLGVDAVGAVLVAGYFRSVAGGLAAPIRDNEIRVEFLGVSVTGIIHTKVVIAGILGGLGGALAALAIGHVDPNMAYWTTSGGFVFVTILAGAGSVAAAFVGSLAFEARALLRLRCDAATVADDARLGAAAHHPVPARRARLAAVRGFKRGGRRRHHEHEQERTRFCRPRSGKDLRLAGGRARHHRQRAGRADCRRHRRQRRRQDHLHQHDYRPSHAHQRQHLVRGQGDHRHALARRSHGSAFRARSRWRRFSPRSRYSRTCASPPPLPGAPGGVFGNVMTPVHSAAAIAEAEATIELFQVGGYRDTPASNLPQGVRKLLDIGMAVVGWPRLLLLDEPTSGISIEEKFDLMNVVMSALKARKITVLFVEHDMEIVARFADRVLAFYDGTVIADGSPAETLDNPQVQELISGVKLKTSAGGSGHA